MTESRARWQRIQQLCDAVEALPAATQDARLRALESDPAIRDEVTALLAALRAEAAQQRLHSIQAPVVSDSLPDHIGGVRIDALIGSGGSGEVFRGVRTIQGVDHVVAVKRYHLHRSSADDLERVAREQRLLATLTHPGIVRFFDAGVTSAGRPYLVMELAEGQPITLYADAGRLTIRERLRLFLNACHAVQSAHALHIVHLDLKPANIIVTPNGHVKLLDFGTAKLTNPTLAPTCTEPLTLQYASPERLRGESVSPSCDVYSLGLIFAELCSGRWPFRQRESLAAIAERATGMIDAMALTDGVTDEAAQLRGTTRDRLTRELRGDLEAVAARAVAHDPSRRYPSVAAFSADLSRYLDGKAVEASPPTVLYRTGRFLRRRARSVLAGLAMLIVVIAAVGYAALQTRQAAAGASSGLRAETSMTTTSGPLSLVFDDVTWSNDTTIAEVQWRGIYCAVVENAPAPPPTATGFVVGFYADAGGRPALVAPLLETTYPIDRVAQTLEIATQARCGLLPTGVGFYNYRVALDTPFRAVAGVPYWVSVRAVVDGRTRNAPGFIFWGWSGSHGGNGRSIQINGDSATRNLSSDRALVLRK
jgi:hypothetical protein